MRVFPSSLPFLLSFCSSSLHPPLFFLYSFQSACPSSLPYLPFFPLQWRSPLFAALLPPPPLLPSSLRPRFLPCPHARQSGSPAPPGSAPWRSSVRCVEESRAAGCAAWGDSRLVCDAARSGLGDAGVFPHAVGATWTWEAGRPPHRRARVCPRAWLTGGAAGSEGGGQRGRRRRRVRRGRGVRRGLRRPPLLCRGTLCVGFKGRVARTGRAGVALVAATAAVASAGAKAALRRLRQRSGIAVDGESMYAGVLWMAPGRMVCSLPFSPSPSSPSLLSLFIPALPLLLSFPSLPSPLFSMALPPCFFALAPPHPSSPSSLFFPVLPLLPALPPLPRLYF
ncbi:hypothetical protein DFH09DRAFT_1440315, partial [Mycena vulgaris]